MSPSMIGFFAALGALAALAVRAVVFAFSVPSSHRARMNCPRCQVTVLKDNYRGILALLSGRCRICHDRIAASPGTVEVLLGTVFVLLAFRYREVWVALAYGWLASHGTAVAMIDIAVRRIPNALTVSAYSGTTLLLSIAAIVDQRPASLLRAVIAGIGTVAFYSILALASRGLGMGDIKLAASLGTALGWIGVTTAVTGTLLGLCLASLYGLVAILMGHLRWKETFALGPFLVLGALITLFVDM